MINFKTTQVKWHKEIVYIEGDVCADDRVVVPGQVLVITKDELEAHDLDALVAQKSIALIESFPAHVVAILDRFDKSPLDVPLRGKARRAVRPRIEPTGSASGDNKPSLIERVRRWRK